MRKWLLALLTVACFAWSTPVWSGEPAADAPVVVTVAEDAPAPAVTPAPASEASEAPAPATTEATSEDTKTAAVPAAKPTPEWVNIVVAVIGSLITLFLVPFLKRKAQAAKAEAAHLATSKKATEIEMRGVLVSRLKSFLWGTAASMAERDIPKIAASVKAGQLKNGADVKKALYDMGGTLRNDAIAYFKNQGVDVLAAVGDDFLDKLIERAANAVSPFPGRETAKMLLQEQVTDWLIEHGVDYVREKYLTDVASAAS